MPSDGIPPAGTPPDAGGSRPARAGGSRPARAGGSRSAGGPLPDADVIAAARLDLVPLRPADAAEMVFVLDDDRLHDFTGGSPADRAQLAARYRRLAAGSGLADEQWLNWIVRLRPDGAAAGTVQATVTGVDSGDRADLAAAIAWVIGVPWQGSGYASEAAIALVGWLAAQSVPLITANIHPGHRASEHVAERAGLTLTSRWTEGERVWETRPPPAR